MRHLKSTAKLGRKSEHRNMMLANLVCSLIYHNRVVTTLAKAKAARRLAEKMVTLGKKGTLHARRLAVARLHQKPAVRILFSQIAQVHKDRHGGYTRIIKLHRRRGDAAEMAILEWVEPMTSTVPVTTKPAEQQKKPEAKTEAKPAEQTAQAEATQKTEAAQPQEQAKPAETAEKKQEENKQ